LNQEKLFFIIGIGRSGTTLLQSIMNTFDGFCNNDEARITPSGISCYAYVIKENDFSFLENFIKTNWTKEFFVEKTPNSILCLPQLHKIYPDANYLFLERHPLKILLSQMNLYPPGERDEKLRKLWLIQGNVTNDDLKLNYEQFKAKHLLKCVQAQVKNKPRFTNQITIRHENFVRHLEDNIVSIKTAFKISPNIDMAKKVLSTPSQSSKNNRYDINELKDEKTIELTKQACALWNYEYRKPLQLV